MTATAATTAQTAQTVRKDLATVRTMMRNLRLKRYEGRNGGGDYTYAEQRAERLTRELPRELQGALWGEHRLALRISEARDMAQERPELRARLVADRRRIKSLLSA